MDRAQWLFKIGKCLLPTLRENGIDPFKLKIAKACEMILDEFVIEQGMDYEIACQLVAFNLAEESNGL